MKVKKLCKEAKLPTKGSERSAGYDLYATKKAAFLPHDTIKIHTGIAVELPKGTFGAIFARSGIATKRGLRPANCVGVIDEDYNGEIIVALHNDSARTETIEAGDRIAQLVVIPYEEVEIEEVDDYALSVTDELVGRDVKVIGLGEATHGNKEFQELKLDVLKTLVRDNGVSAICFEMDYAEGLLVNEYISGKSDMTIEDVFSHISFDTNGSITFS